VRQTARMRGGSGCEMLAVPVDNFDPKSATSVTL
jgi:hypothetical protein